MAAAASSSAISRVPVYSTTASTGNKVGTHSSSFHCDEALGCFIIRLTDKFSGADVVRSRDPQVLDAFDAVLDVGGVYDPSCDRYDHHQKGFNEVFGHGFKTKLSTAGLVYKHYGMEVIAKELQLDEGHEDVLRLYLAVYKNFVEALDAIDNGINQYDTDQPPKYVNNTHLSSRVGRLNLDWVDPDQSVEKENAAFHQAMILAGADDDQGDGSQSGSRVRLPVQDRPHRRLRRRQIQHPLPIHAQRVLSRLQVHHRRRIRHQDPSD